MIMSRIVLAFFMLFASVTPLPAQTPPKIKRVARICSVGPRHLGVVGEKSGRP